MNERLKELVEKATTIEVISGRGYDTTQYITRFDKEKFAELIIRGCARKANATALDLRNNPDLDGRKYVGDCILKCFGVEE